MSLRNASPADELAHLERQVEQLLGEMQQLQIQLADRNVRDGTGKRLDAVAYSQWRTRLNRALVFKQQRYHRLRDQIADLRLVVDAENPRRCAIYVPPDMGQEEFLLRCHQEWARISRLRNGNEPAG